MFDDLLTYPKDISAIQIRILRLDRKIRKMQQQVDRLTADIEQAIANDPEMKNDQQRRAKRLALLQADEYVALVNTSAEATERKTRLEIDLQCLRNEFSVLKLQYRDYIVSKEVAIA